RARQDSRADYDHSLIVPVLIHGDAAFAGQGVVMETLNLSQTRGFNTGGTIHIIVNNQIGFTTSNPHDARSSMYCTDIGKMIDTPIFHVNGDDPEACVFAMQLALDYRMEFKTDVFIDLVCYRRLGHNEGDEPSATQPLMYKKIRQHPRNPEIYAKKLIEENIVTAEDVTAEDERYRHILDTFQPIIPTVPKSEVRQHYADWSLYKDKSWDVAYDTKISLTELKRLGEAVTTLPEGFTLQAQVAKEYENRRLMIEGKMPLNWGMAETLAYATLLDQGYPIRLTGQDCGRGTFAHRHAIVYDQNDGTAYTPLAHLTEEQPIIWINDSALSEEGVLGFEYGYATTEPETLVIWEAQYGDFMNGAQVVIDQFITSGEQKWSRLCGLTMFLPHGYQGAGPEHSSARLERFLQSCAQQNIQVCVPSTPSQIYHLIRRQMLRPYRKPLVVFSPKNLLRHKLVISTLEDLTDGKFELIIPEIDDLNPKKVKKVVLCTGKVYYDLLEKRREAKLDTVAIVRIEQLYPFPQVALTAELKRYPNAKEVIWCQEEPKNQGSWYSINHRLHICLAKGQTLDYAGRPASASPATGYSSIHAQEQAALVKEALGL
ncbi:MAG: 2-oxoglutarate dehydrogenase E1 component, partial [Gammaproteobacteria bacterium]